MITGALMTSCNSNSKKTISDKVIENKVVVDVSTLRNKVIQEIKSYGAKDAYFDKNGYFVYCVVQSDITATPNAVAKAMYPMVQDVPSTKGCIVVDFYTKKELGRYEK